MADRGKQDTGAMQITPTLFIGCGGTGYDVLIRLKAKADEFLPPAESRKIYFMVLDTDSDRQPVTNSYGDVVEFKDENQIVDIGAVPVAQIILEKDKYPAIKAAFNLDALPPRDLRKGAKQVRQLGRLALFYHFTAIRHALEFGIAKITSITDPGKIMTINIVIVCSASGGTGSGIVIDIAYLARYIATTNHSLIAHQVNILGYLALPEYFTDLPQENEKQIRVNAFALLTEIDHFAHFRDFSAMYPGRAAPIRDESPPFSRLYLLDATNENGRHVKGILQLAPLLAEAIYLATLMPHGAKVDSNVDNISPIVRDVWGNDHEAYASLGVAAFSIQPHRMHAACSRLLARTILREGLLRKDSKLLAIFQQGEPENEDEYEEQIRQIETLLESSTLVHTSGSLTPGTSHELFSFDIEDIVTLFKQPIESMALNDDSAPDQPLNQIRIGRLSSLLFSDSNPGRAVKAHCDTIQREELLKVKQHVASRKREIRTKLFAELAETCKNNVKLTNSPIAMVQLHLTQLKRNLNRSSRQLRVRHRQVEYERRAARVALKDCQQAMEIDLERKGLPFFGLRKARRAAEDYKEKVEFLIEMELERMVLEEALALFSEYLREIDRWENAINVLTAMLENLHQEASRTFDRLYNTWSSSFVTETRLDSHSQIESEYKKYTNQPLQIYLSGLQKNKSLGVWLEKIRFQEQAMDEALPATMQHQMSEWLTEYCEDQMKGLLDDSIIQWFDRNGDNTARSNTNTSHVPHTLAEQRLSMLEVAAAPLTNLRTTRGGFGSKELPQLRVMGVPDKIAWQHNASGFQGTIISTHDYTRIAYLRVCYGFYLEMLSQYPNYALVFAQNMTRYDRRTEARPEHCFPAGHRHTELLRTLMLCLAYGVVSYGSDPETMVVEGHKSARTMPTALNSNHRNFALNLDKFFDMVFRRERLTERLNGLLKQKEIYLGKQRISMLENCLKKGGILAEDSPPRTAHLLPVLRVFAMAQLEYLRRVGL